VVSGSIVARRSRFASLLPVFLFLALRALSHAHPTPFPWTSGFFDAQGLDDVLQTIRIAYTAGAGVRHLDAGVLALPTGRVSIADSSRFQETFFATTHPRGPPLS
jgi:hypothetical protein